MPFYPTYTADDQQLLTRTILLTPTSRGSISISSSNPKAPPLINPNYYATETDRVMLREGLRQLGRILSLPVDSATADSEDTGFLSRIKISELCPDKFKPITPSSSDEDIDDRIRHMSEVMWHPMGSCAIGQVVDSNLKVFGPKENTNVNIRIADASIFPEPVATHPQATVYVVGKRAASMIAEEWRAKHNPVQK